MCSKGVVLRSARTVCNTVLYKLALAAMHSSGIVNACVLSLILRDMVDKLLYLHWPNRKHKVLIHTFSDQIYVYSAMW
jgi:hypothetical protein